MADGGTVLVQVEMRAQVLVAETPVVGDRSCHRARIDSLRIAVRQHLDSIAGREQRALLDAGDLLEKLASDVARGAIRQSQALAQIDGGRVMREPDEPELATRGHDPKVPPWRPEENTLTPTNDTKRTAKLTIVNVAARRPRQPMLRPCSRTA